MIMDRCCLLLVAAACGGGGAVPARGPSTILEVEPGEHLYVDYLDESPEPVPALFELELALTPYAPSWYHRLQAPRGPSGWFDATPRRAFARVASADVLVIAGPDEVSRERSMFLPAVQFPDGGSVLLDGEYTELVAGALTLTNLVEPEVAMTRHLGTASGGLDFESARVTGSGSPSPSVARVAQHGADGG